MAIIESLCAMFAAVGVLAWNAILTERRRRELRLHRSKSARECSRADRQDLADAAGAGSQEEEKVEETRLLEQLTDGVGASDGGAELRRVRSSPEALGTMPCHSSSLPTSAIEEEQTTAVVAPQKEEKEKGGEKGTFSSFPSVATKSAQEDDGRGGRACPAMFRELVLIMDSTPLPEPRQKLPGLPEDFDPCALSGMDSTSSTVGTAALSPPRGGGDSSGGGRASDNGSMRWGCDLSQDFYLCRPFSPPRSSRLGRRGGSGGGFHRRTMSHGNRPRTFSEYTPGNDDDSTAAAAVSSTTTIGPGTQTECRRRRLPSGLDRMERSKSAVMVDIGMGPRRRGSASAPWGRRRGGGGGVGGGLLGGAGWRETDSGASDESVVHEHDGILDPLFFMEDGCDDIGAGGGDGSRGGGGGRRDRCGAGLWPGGDDSCCSSDRYDGDNDDDGDDEDDVFEGLAQSAFEKNEESDGVWMVWPATGKLELARNHTDDSVSESTLSRPTDTTNMNAVTNGKTSPSSRNRVRGSSASGLKSSVGSGPGSTSGGIFGAGGVGAGTSGSAGPRAGAGGRRPLYPHARAVLPVS